MEINTVDKGKMMKVLLNGPQRKLVNGPADDALFPPFVFEGDEYFYYYDASIECWAISKTVSVENRVIQPLPDLDDDGESSTDVEAMNALSFMPPPRQPAEFSDPMFRGPFWFGNRQFAWVMLSREEGWQLAFSGSPEAHIAA